MSPPRQSPLLILLLSLLAIACLTERAALPPTGAARATATDSEAATPTTPTSAKTSAPAPEAPEGSESDEPADSEQTEKTGEAEEPEKAEKAEEPRKPGKIILDTEYDDRRVGDEQTDAVRAEMGIVEDEALNRYVQSVAIRLLRHAPPRPF